MKATFRQLEYFIAVLDYGNFRRAAEACCVSQPTLTLQIQKLERQLEVELLHRSHRQVKASAAGCAIATQARKVLQEHRGLLEIAEENRNPLGGEFRLGVIPTVAPYLLPRVLPKVHTRLPSLRLHLAEIQTENLLDQLDSGSLDAGILAQPIDRSRIHGVHLYREKFWLTVHEHNPLTRVQSVTPDSLKREEMLLLDEGHCLREQALEICHSHDAKINPRFRAASLETLRHLVAQNMGSTLMPALAVHATPKVKYLQFASDIPYRDIGLFWIESSHRVELYRVLSEIFAIELNS